MSTRRLILLFTGVFVLWALATLPLSTVLPAFKLAAAGISYARAEGTAWNGTLIDARWRGHALGTVTMKAHPSGLLLGQAQVRIALTGGALGAGEGSLVLWPNGTVALTDARLSANAKALPVMLPLDGQVNLDVREIALNRRGCRAAAATLRTDTLARRPAGLAWTGPVLTGTISCDQGALVVQLDGTDEEETVAAVMTVTGDGTFGLNVQARTGDNAVLAVLSAAGFRDVGGAMTLTQKGRWLTAAKGLP